MNHPPSLPAFQGRTLQLIAQSADLEGAGCEGVGGCDLLVDVGWLRGRCWLLVAISPTWFGALENGMYAYFASVYSGLLLSQWFVGLALGAYIPVGRWSRWCLMLVHPSMGLCVPISGGFPSKRNAVRWSHALAWRLKTRLMNNGVYIANNNHQPTSSYTCPGWAVLQFT